MNDNARKIQVCTAVVHNAKELAENLHDTWVEEMKITDAAIDRFAEGKLSPGHMKAAIRYRDHLLVVKQMIDTFSGIDTAYFLDHDHFNLPDDSSTEE